MKKILLLMLALGLSASAFSQVMLNGRVLDRRTKEPIKAVAVYLNGTSLFTTTDADGYFRLRSPRAVNASLVFSHIAYETVVVDNPFELEAREFFLDEKSAEITEITVNSQLPFSRMSMLKIFKDNFIGREKGALRCSIENEDDIYFWYNGNTLSAGAVRPLIIRNLYLGYVVTAELVSFSIEFDRKLSIDPKHVTNIVYGVMSSFQDMDPASNRFARRRKEAYGGSSVDFFHNIVSGTLEQSKFSIMLDDGVIPPQHYFSVRDSSSMKLIQILPDRFSHDPADLRAGIVARISVLYDGYGDTEIMFRKPSFLVDSYGVAGDYRSITYRGEMARYRMAWSLPLDYVP